MARLPRSGHPRPRLDRRVRGGPGAVEAAQWIVWEAAQELGARSASIHELYMARARGEVSGFTVPAINLRAQTFDMARIVFETATTFDVGAVILELARSEQTYTYQRPIDYSTSVLAGAIAADWQGPVFLQGDHYQFNAKKYARRSGVDDRGDPARLPPRRRCRLPQHRHRRVDPGRPVAADATTTSSARTTSGRRSWSRSSGRSRPTG